MNVCDFVSRLAYYNQIFQAGKLVTVVGSTAGLKEIS